MTKICAPPAAWDWAGALPNTYLAVVTAEGKLGGRQIRLWNFHREMTGVQIADRRIYRCSTHAVLRADGVMASASSYNVSFEPTGPRKNALGDRDVRLYIGTAYAPPPDQWASEISQGDNFAAWAKSGRPKKIQELKKLSGPGFGAWQDPDGLRGLNRLWGHWECKYGKTRRPAFKTELRLNLNDEDPTRIRGKYGEYNYDRQEFDVSGTVRGTLKSNGKHLTGKWREGRAVLPAKTGTFDFKLDDNWNSFTGTYTTDEGIDGHWNGER